MVTRQAGQETVAPLETPVVTSTWRAVGDAPGPP